MQENQARKYYLDNIRWFTILLVVIFHVFFYFNNIGHAGIFAGLPDFNLNDPMRADTVFQYAVYPWFMVLLFVVAGISARYSLQKRTPKEFLRNRRCRLLVPSTLGLLCFGWISGYIVSTQTPSDIGLAPAPVRFIIYTLSGTGALWFCQVLFIESLLLILMRKIDIAVFKQEKLFNLDSIKSLSTKKAYCIVCAVFLPAFFFLLWGGSKILNVPVINCYRFGIFTVAFFAGYYVFSQDFVEKIIIKLRFVTFPLAVLFGIFFVKTFYGVDYTDSRVLSTLYANLFTYFAVLAILGIFSAYFNKCNAFTKFANRESFAVFIVHITVMCIVLRLLSYTSLGLCVKYIVAFLSTLTVSIPLGIALKKIPFVCFVLFGIRRK